MSDSDFSKSMSGYFESVSQSVHNASQKGLQNAVNGQLIPADQSVLKDISQASIVGDGIIKSPLKDHYEAPFSGPNAPITARLVASLLNHAGASNIERQPTANSNTDRIVSFNVDPQEELQIARKFATQIQALKTEETVLTRIFAASHALDHKRGEGVGSKIAAITPITSSEGKIGFSLALQTNERSLISKMQQADFKGTPRGTLQTSDMRRLNNGVNEFHIFSEKLETALATIEDFAREQTQGRLGVSAIAPQRIEDRKRTGGNPPGFS